MTWDLIRNTHQNLTGQCPKVFPCEKLIISQCHSNFISERWKAVFHRVINYPSEGEERNSNVNSFQESLIREDRFMFIKYSLTKKQNSQKMSQFIQIIFLQIVEVKSRNLTKVPPGKKKSMLLYYTVNMFTTYEQAHANKKDKPDLCINDLVIKMILRRKESVTCH